MNNQQNITVLKAIAIGQAWVNLPVLAIMLVPFLLSLQVMPPNGSWFILLVSFFLAWGWWSLMVPRWRKWALKHGADPEYLQKVALITGLVWPKGSILEKTEFDVGDE